MVREHWNTYSVPTVRLTSGEASSPWICTLTHLCTLPHILTLQLRKLRCSDVQELAQSHELHLQNLALKFMLLTASLCPLNFISLCSRDLLRGQSSLLDCEILEGTDTALITWLITMLNKCLICLLFQCQILWLTHKRCSSIQNKWAEEGMSNSSWGQKE